MNKRLERMLILCEVQKLAPHTPGLLKLLQQAAQSSDLDIGDAQVCQTRLIVDLGSSAKSFLAITST